MTILIILWQLILITYLLTLGKISRTLASKCSLCIRVDALGEEENAEIGVQSRDFVEKRVQFLEQNAQGGYIAKPQKQSSTKVGGKRTNEAYNQSADVVGI